MTTRRAAGFGSPLLAALVAAVTVPASNAWASARALDGDDVLLDGQDYRIMAVDTPEPGQVCKDGSGVDYDCGAKAKAALESILVGRSVRCVSIKRDRKRAIANCLVGDLDVATALVRSGWGLVRRDFIADSATAREAVEVAVGKPNIEPEARDARSKP